jgi:phage tail sheath protein FI
VVDPGVKVLDTDGSFVNEPASARVAGIIAKSDAERGFWWSPSNRQIYGIVGTTRAVDFALGDANARANLLNEGSIATIIRQDGFRLWGNRTLSDDPKWAFLSVVRTADMINESLLRAHLWAVDRNITKTYLEDVVEGVNAYLSHLTQIGAILGGRCWANPDLNTPSQLEAGKVYFDFDFTPPTPAEHVTFRSRLVNDYFEEVV